MPNPPIKTHKTSIYFFIFIFNPFVNGQSVFGWIGIWLRNKGRKLEEANKITENA